MDGNRVSLLDGTNSLPSFTQGAQTENESGQVEVNTDGVNVRTIKILSGLAPPVESLASGHAPN